MSSVQTSADIGSGITSMVDPGTSLSNTDVFTPPSPTSGSFSNNDNIIDGAKTYYILAGCLAGSALLLILASLLYRVRRQRRERMATAYGVQLGPHGPFNTQANVALQANNSHHKSPVVLTDSQFDLLPRQTIRDDPLQHEEEGSGEQKKESKGTDDDRNICSICISEFQTDEEMVTLFPCNHTYHSDCARKWLTKKSTLCPLCKTDMLVSLGVEGTTAEPRELETGQNTNRRNSAPPTTPAPGLTHDTVNPILEHRQTRNNIHGR